MLLKDRAVVVTGGGRGIGKATAEAVVAHGGKVAILDILDAGEKVAQSLLEHGGEAVFFQADVRDEDAVRHAVTGAAERFGTIDVLVNNAGVNADFDATTMTRDDWEGFFAIDLRAAWVTAKYALPYMTAQRRGSIVNITSIHARMTGPHNFPYAAAKAGLEGLTRSLAMDYGQHDIRVNAVAPGFTRTPLVQLWLDQHADPVAADREVCARHPLNRMAEPSEVASAVVFLASDLANAVTATVLAVDCGHSDSVGG